MYINRFRPTWADINLDHFKDNFQKLQALHPKKTMIPVIKADAYGHGMIEVANVLIKENISVVAVAILEEALYLREHFKTIDIMILGVVLPEQINVCSDANIIVTIHDVAFGESLLSSACPVSCQINIDTGFHGLGMNNHAEANELIKRIQASSHIDLVGLYTHFATAESNQSFCESQVKAFKDFILKLEKKPPMIHMSNTAGLMTVESDADFTTHTRPGLGLYGMSPMSILPIDLKPVMTLKSKIVLIKHLKPGDSVSYGATYQALEDEIIAVIPMGYADGWIRKNRDHFVESNQKKYPLIGTICMDLGMVKIDKTVKKGDEVTFFGGLISVDEVANRLETINYEITTTIGFRVPRVYKTTKKDEGKQ